jgi:4-diphosphocytidyl-2-C-methyl-D-erythritol kinase
VTAPDLVRIAAHAKVNLFLRVLARESGGHHQIETAFALLDLADTLEVTRTPAGVSVDVEGPDLGPAADNLAGRAAEAVLAATGRRFGVHIALTKRIPVRAGLGGGSSDAAAALHAVNALAAGAVPRPELMHFAARLGADVAFLASGAPMALAWGRGERLFRLAPLPALPVLVAVPDAGIATADAYRWWDELHPTPESRGPVVLDADALASWGSVGRLGGNDFEAVVFARHPAIRTAYEQLADTRPLWVRMCGSGGAVAAVYRSARDRDDAAARLGRRHGTLIPTATRDGPADGPSVV